jgi:predicted GNAT family N-acyltransferase
MEVHVVSVSWASHGAKLREVRRIVFIEEQRVPAELEWEDQDQDAHHFLAINEAGQPVGCARLLPSGQIGRMAVIETLRGRSIGERLLAAAVERARDLGMQRLFLNAQTQAEGFYRRAGFLPVGGIFMEAGIPHQRMELELPVPFEPPAEVVRPIITEASTPTHPKEHPDEPLRSDLRSFKGAAACLESLREALARPRRHLMIYSQQLEHGLFDRPEVVDALSDFARGGPPVRLQILIHDSSAAVARGHRLVELARRLDSKIAIRRVPEALADSEATFLCWDGTGYWLQPDHAAYAAVSDPYDPVQAGRLGERFTYLWERSAPDPELRVLRL